MRGACAVAGSDEHRVALRMPGRSGPAKANGRESTADRHVLVPVLFRAVSAQALARLADVRGAVGGGGDACNDGILARGRRAGAVASGGRRAEMNEPRKLRP